MQSANELLDIVDDQDNVVGQATRWLAHSQGLKHRAVHILVFNRAGQLFLQHRSASKDTYPNCWDSSAAGHVEAGETYDTCALRELEEELGITPSQALVRLFKLHACAETGQEFVWVYRCTSDATLRLNRDEIQQGRWVTATEFNQWLQQQPQVFAPTLPLIWSTLCLQQQTHPQQSNVE